MLIAAAARPLAAVALVLAAPGAQALDCVPVDVATSYLYAEASPVNFVILVGQLLFDVSHTPGDAQPDPVVFPMIPAKFVGSMLMADGFTDEAIRPVDVQFVCAGSWCGHLPPMTDKIIAFTQVIDGRYVIEVEPCGSWVFGADTANIAALTACMRGDACLEMAE